MQRKKVAREFKREAVRRVRERGVATAQAARELDVYENVLRNWAKELTADSESRVSSCSLQPTHAAKPAWIRDLVLRVAHPFCVRPMHTLLMTTASIRAAPVRERSALQNAEHGRAVRCRP